MPRILFVALTVTVALSACAGEPEVAARWAKQGATDQDLMATRASCVAFVERQDRPFFVASVRDPAKHSGVAELVADIELDFGVRDPALTGFDTELFRRCMNGHGWHMDPKGFTAPDDDELAMGR